MGPTGMAKRALEDDETSPVGARKKRKVEVETDDDNSFHVGAHELASAFALASLATLSPDNSRHQTAPEGRDADQGEDESTTSIEETRHPKEEPTPITPEARSPIRQGSKKVTFAPDIKSPERQGPRRYAIPPRIRREQVSRMPPGFMNRRNLIPSQVTLQMQHMWLQQRKQRMMLPPGFIPPQPMMPQTQNQWICDFCNVASFATYQEACIHEEGCAIRCHMAPRRPPMWHTLGLRPVGMPIPSSPVGSFEAPPSPAVTLPSASSREWFQGSTNLAVPESDAEWLSELNCFIRSTCVEVFSASGDQVERTSKRGRISLHQVGLRCAFCTHRPVDERAIAAISFPSSVSGLYESVKRWQRVHLEVCEDIPRDVRDKIGQLATANVWIPTTRQYWADSARALGMVDTEDGIRFASDPDKKLEGQALEFSVTRAQRGASKGTRTGSALADGSPIVFAEDLNLVPPYVYFLMSQVESCLFTEADRFVARSKGPVGYPGFQCRHCNGHAGLGKYFPVTAKSLSTNSTSQNIHAHLLKCRKCPAELKQKLVELKEEKTKAPRLEPGWRKVFFDKVWTRLHG